MSKWIASSIILLVPGQLSAASKIDEVVVFADRAKVKRVASTNCKDGAGTAVFEPLPAGLDARTLRGIGKSVVGVSSSIVSDGRPIDERAAKHQAERKKLQQDIAVVSNRRAL